MRALGRIVVGVLAVLGALTLLLVVGGLVVLRTTSVGIGEPAPTPQSTTTAPAPPSGSGDLVADNLTADVTVPFARLEQQAGDGVRLSDAGDGKIRVNAPFSALGRQLRVETDGEMTVDGADVVVQPASLRIEGLPALDGVLSAVARQAAGVRVPITDLPSGVTVQRVTSTPQGLRAHVQGNGVPLPAS